MIRNMLDKSLDVLISIKPIRNAAKTSAALLWAASMAYCCSESHEDEKEETKTEEFFPPQFISEPTNEGQVNVNYSYEVQTDNPDASCYIAEGPAWMEIQNNVLSGIPTHISNEDAGKTKVRIDCESNNLFSSQEFELDIAPGTLASRPGKQFAHIEFIDANEDGIDDAVALCQIGTNADGTPMCPESMYDNNGWMSLKVLGMKLAISELFDTTQLGFTLSQYMPVEIRLAADEVCQTPEALGTSTSGVICDYHSDWIEKGISLSGESSCLNNERTDPNDPSSPLKYPEACIDESTYISPDSIEAQGTIMHEAGHAILSHIKVVNNKTEHIVSPIAIILSKNQGNRPELESFQQLNWAAGYSSDYHWLFYELSKDFTHLDETGNVVSSFDMKDMPEFFRKMQWETTTNASKYIRNRTLPVGEIKCILDSIVDGNTYQYVVDNICNSTNPFTQDSCELSDPRRFTYVNPEPCGDKYEGI